VIRAEVGEDSMGVDWVRAYVPQDSRAARLEELVEQQAVAFQSMWGWSSHAASDYDAVRRALNERLHFAAYHAASDSLRELLTFPEWYEARGCPRDLPELAASWRVYAITYNPIFPPLWRLQANRTLLPDRLRLQIREWKRWIEQAAGGERDDYLRELHLCDTSDFMHYHWSYLRGNATASLSEDGHWAKKPDLDEVRERILRLSEPIVTDARLDPSDGASADGERLDAHCRGLFDDLAVLLDLTRAWNSMVQGNWKVPDYEDSYALTFDAFKEKARDPWLLHFLQWTEDCAERGFALYLDD
jgi:hypothetical protein